MLMAVAGRYTADTEEKMSLNPDAMNIASAEVYRKGHVPEIPNHNR